MIVAKRWESWVAISFTVAAVFGAAVRCTVRFVRSDVSNTHLLLTLVSGAEIVDF